MQDSGLVQRLKDSVLRTTTELRTSFGGLVMAAVALCFLAAILSSPLLLILGFSALAYCILHLHGTVRFLASGDRRRPVQAREFTSSITIVVPLYNEEKHIRSCLESIKNQSLVQWRCLIVDDASTDRGPVLAQQFTKDDPRFELIRHRRNRGLSAARNTGLRYADSTLVTFLDADDLLLSDSLLERVYRYEQEQQDPALAGAFCGILPFGENETVARQSSGGEYRTGIADSITILGECPFNAHAPLIRRDILVDIGGFDESMLAGAEDWDCWQRIMRHGFYFSSTGSIGGLYRRKIGSMTRNGASGHLAQAREIYSKAEQPFSLAASFEGVVPFTKPVSQYPPLITLLSRTARFAASSYVTGGVESLQQVIASIEEPSGSFLLRHIDLHDTARQAAMNALAITNPASDPRFSEVSGIVETAIRERLSQLDELAIRNSSIVGSRTFTALLLVTDPFEARCAIHDFKSLPKGSEVGIIVPAADDDQGVLDLLTYAGVGSFSISDLVFGAVTANQFLAYRNSGFFAEEFGKLAQSVGCHVDQVQLDEEDTQNIDSDLPSLATAIEGRRSVEETLARKARTSTFRYPPRIFELEESGDADHRKLEAMRDLHQGERCVIVGNGPSLNSTRLEYLSGEVTIATNGIFYKTEESGFMPTFFVVEDTSVMQENLDRIIDYDPEYKLFPAQYRSLHPPGERTLFFRMNRGFYEKSGPNYCVPRFSVEFPERAYCGQSVTYINLQLAYFLGFTEVYLVGVDFDYRIPDSAIRNGDNITSTESDPNHFHPDYFGAGKTWKDPKLDRVLLNYQYAKRIFESTGRKIYNATQGGKLEVFERVDYESTFRP